MTNIIRADNVELGFLIASSVFLFFGLLQTLVSFCRVRSALICLTVFVPLLGIIAWIAFAVTFPLTSLFADCCNSALAYQADPQTSVITEYVPCPDKDTAMESLADAYSSINGFVEEVNYIVSYANAESGALLNACSGIENAQCDEIRDRTRILNLLW